MTGSLIDGSTPLGGNGLVLKGGVPLKTRLLSFSSKKSAPEKQITLFVESRSPSCTSTYTTECYRDEPEEVILHAPTARRLSELSQQRKRRISFSRKRQTQIRSPRQSKKCMKKLPPALSGSGTSLNSPWVTPTIAQVNYPPSDQGQRDCDRVGSIQTVSTEEQDLPPVISPAYKFVTIEMAERIEAEEALEFSSFSSTDYDICSDEYMASLHEHAREEKSTPASTSKTTKRKKSQINEMQKKQRSQNKEVDKYSMHEAHSPCASPSTCDWWSSLEEGASYIFSVLPHEIIGKAG